MELVEAWSKEKHGAAACSRSMEQTEAWSEKKYAASRSMDQKEECT
jgi:hypothetical protein